MYYRTQAVPNNRITCAVQDSELVLNFLMTRCGIANILELVTYIIYSTVLTRWDIDLAGISSYRSPPPLPTNREFKSRLRRKVGSRGGRTKIRGGGGYNGAVAVYSKDKNRFKYHFTIHYFVCIKLGLGLDISSY